VLHLGIIIKKYMTNLRQGAWDSYVQGDPMQMWSMNLEVNPLDSQQAQQQQAQQQAQQQLAQQAQQASMNNMFMGPAGAANMM
jgi:hypothetical protein